ncbi:TIGR03620 family F420-dependent LLM class oxidoreductase [Roseicella aerolata]|uniref:TIGR03620 family F420-dependent LLM class oxidoreductase n=1 Tax=Roseicella aerolata TaxID=2883479 RepID=A0A9X1IEY3_9PROT|nr:TIGR03620 family F420-dependent LLM class oxidoreductase [Roseicella aerolata]MCB4822483.1 TIGR03620 family F420-dependent LLM class oxidoreductase [Roseicella aerolata]
MEFGRLGVWCSTDRLDAAGLRSLLRSVEKEGYGTLWYPESRGYESIALGSFLLANSTRLVIGSSIANIYARDAFTARRALASLNALHDGRFALGLGVSHIPMVEGLRGHHYDKPVPAMRAYLEGIRRAGGEAPEGPVLLAALGPKMLALSAAQADGAVPYNVTPEHTRQAAQILGPGKVLAVEQKVCVETDKARARALGRRELARYMTLPNYVNNWLRLGFTEDELKDGGSDRFIDAMVLSGDAETVKTGLRTHFAAGATHVCIQPVTEEGDTRHRDAMLAALADS